MDVTAVIIAVAGWVFTWAMQTDSKAREKLTARVKKLEDEVRARIVLESVSNAWLSELAGQPERSVMLEARKRTEAQSGGLRPTMSISSLS